MSDTVVDSCVIAKWILPESDSRKAQQLITEVPFNGDRLFVVDLALSETANAIWKRCHNHTYSVEQSTALLIRLWEIPLYLWPSADLLEPAFDIAVKYDRSVYDALFVALANDRQLTGITTDEPLWRAVHEDFPNIVLLRDWAPTT